MKLHKGTINTSELFSMDIENNLELNFTIDDPDLPPSNSVPDSMLVECIALVEPGTNKCSMLAFNPSGFVGDSEDNKYLTLSWDVVSRMERSIYNTDEWWDSESNKPFVKEGHTLVKYVVRLDGDTLHQVDGVFNLDLPQSKQRTTMEEFIRAKDRLYGCEAWYSTVDVILERNDFTGEHRLVAFNGSITQATNTPEHYHERGRWVMWNLQHELHK